MTFIIFMMIIASLLDDHDKPRRSKKKHYHCKRNDSWLDQAWFHDHNQII